MLCDPLDDLVRITDTASNGERKRVAKGVLACWSLEVLVLPCASWLPQDPERDPPLLSCTMPLLWFLLFHKSVLYFRKWLGSLYYCKMFPPLLSCSQIWLWCKWAKPSRGFLFISRTIQEKKDINSTFSPFSVIEPLNTKHPAWRFPTKRRHHPFHIFTVSPFSGTICICVKLSMIAPVLSVYYSTRWILYYLKLNLLHSAERSSGKGAYGKIIAFMIILWSYEHSS